MVAELQHPRQRSVSQRIDLYTDLYDNYDTRVEVRQRDQLKQMADRRQRTMIDTLDAALDALRRREFFIEMEAAELQLRARPDAWAAYQSESARWLYLP